MQAANAVRLHRGCNTLSGDDAYGVQVAMLYPDHMRVKGPATFLSTRTCLKPKEAGH